MKHSPSLRSCSLCFGPDNHRMTQQQNLSIIEAVIALGMFFALRLRWHDLFISLATVKMSKIRLFIAPLSSDTLQ